VAAAASAVAWDQAALAVAWADHAWRWAASAVAPGWSAGDAALDAKAGRPKAMMARIRMGMVIKALFTSALSLWQVFFYRTPIAQRITGA